MAKNSVKTSPFYATILILQLACTTNPTAEEPLLSQQRVSVGSKRPSEALPKEYLQAYAELIQPRTINAFGHLTGYEGHALIGNSRVQAVVSGVDPQAERRNWNPLILALFHRTDDQWRKIDSIFDVSFKRNANGRPVPTQIEAVLPTSSPRNKAAYLDVVYSRVDHSEPREFLRLYLDEVTDELFVTIDSTLITPKPSLVADRVRLQINRQRGESIMIGDGLVHYSTDDILTVAGSQTPNQPTMQQNQSIELQSSGVNKAGWDGFVIGIGPKGGAEAHFNASARKICFSDQTTVETASLQPDLIQFFQVIRRCQSELPKGELQVRLSADQSPLALILRRFILMNSENAILGYTYGLPGSTIHIPLVANEKYKMKEVATGAEWGDSTPIRVAKGGSETLSLSSRRPAEMQVVAAPTTSAALLTVRSAINPKGVNFTNDVNLQSEGTRMSESVLLVRAWPVKLRLPPGQYQFEFFREGTANSICAVTATVSEEERKNIDCGTMKQGVVVPNQSIDLDTPTNHASIESLKHALKVEHITVNAENEPRQAITTDLQKLEIIDPRTLLSLSAFPLSDDISRQWLRIGLKHDGNDLERFAKFVKKKAPDAILQLNCPANNISGRELQTWLEQLKPDAIQYYGCDTRTDIQQAFDRVFRQAHPPLITPVSGLRSPENSAFFPRIALSSPLPENKHVDGIGSSIKDGQYVIYAGSQLALINFRMQHLGPTQRRVQGRILVRSESNVVPLTLQVYSGTTVIYEKNLPLTHGDSFEEELDFNAPLTALRFEISGKLKDNLEGRAAPDRLTFASTNFIEFPVSN